MRRREAFWGLLAAPLLVRSGWSQPARVPTVALLTVGRPEGPGDPSGPMHETVRTALADLGWIDGQTVRLEVAHARGRIHDLGGIVEELARKQVDVIVAGGGTVTAASFKATRTIPIVMAASAFDPVHAGWAESYARPGRNVTGLTFATDDAVGKQLELLKKVAPGVGRVALLRTRGNLANAGIVERARSVAPQVGLETTIGDIGSADEVESTIQKLRNEGAEAVLAVVDPAMDNLRNRIAAVAIPLRMPTVGQLPFYAEAGFLITYAADLRLLHRRSAEYVDRILKGAKPGDIPIERPTKFLFTLNARTARAMNLAIDPTVLALADEVIE
jgi:putative ABC transport system substrate-binding protein